MKIDKIKVSELVKQGLKDSEISKILNCSTTGVYNCRKRNKIERSSFSIAKPIKLNKQQESFIVGCLLGDGHMRIDKNCLNPRFTCEHGINQIEYCKYKHSILKSLNSKFRTYKRNKPDKRTGKYYETCKVFIGNNPEFLKFYNMFYKNNIKVISKEIYNYFNEFSLAIMFMDDGYKTQNSICISTDCFNKTDLNEFIDFLFEKYEIRFTIHKGNKLYLPAKFYLKFKNLIINYIHPTMMYKLH